MFHIKINYGQSVVSLPSLPADVLRRATADDLRLLLLICTPGITSEWDSIDACCAALMEHGAGSAMQIAASLSFWRGVGVLELTEAEAPQAAASAQAAVPSAYQPPVAPPAPEPTPATNVTLVRHKHTLISEELTHYDQNTLADYLEKNAEIRTYIDECSRVWGRMLNMREVNYLVSTVEELGLGWDFIITLMARSVQEGNMRGVRPSMYAVQREAYRLHDDLGIRTLDGLEEEFRRRDDMNSMQGRLRTLFGMGDRKMTPTETKCFSAWVHDFGYGMDIIELAYNAAVDLHGKPKIIYINAILENWNAQNLRTPADVEAMQLAHRAEQDQKRAAASKKPAPQKPETAPAGGGSFNTSDFFTAAVQRSLGEDFVPDES